MSCSADCLETAVKPEEGAGGDKLSQSEGGTALGGLKGDKKGREEEEEDDEDDDDDKYDEEEEEEEGEKEGEKEVKKEGEKEGEKDGEGKASRKESKEDKRLRLVRGREDQYQKQTNLILFSISSYFSSFFLSQSESDSSLKVPLNEKDLQRCESDSKIPPKTNLGGSPVPFSPEKSQSSPHMADGMLLLFLLLFLLLLFSSYHSFSFPGPKREHSRLIQFSNISKNQFRQNAPLTVKRSRSPPSIRATSSPCSYTPSPSGSPLATSEGVEVDEEQGGGTDKRGRRTTLAITPTREEEGKVFGRVLSVNRLGGKAREKRDSVRTSIARKKENRKDKD